jgi:hypothetical protein
MKTITVRWERTRGDPPSVAYYLDGEPVGEGDAGFDKILDVIRSHDEIQVNLKIGEAISLGGGSLGDTFPFRERLDELREALGENRLVYEFS